MRYINVFVILQLVGERIVRLGRARPAMEASHKTHRPQIKVGKDEEENKKKSYGNSYHRQAAHVLYSKINLSLYLGIQTDDASYRGNVQLLFT